jgi:copper(I)-binding protein
MVTACALAVVFASAGCVGTPPISDIDTMGTNGSVGPVLLRNVYLEAPEGGAYRPGDTATLRLRVVNDGARDDRLENVRSAVAGGLDIHWDDDCDGTFDVVESLPVQAEDDVPFSQAYYVQLTGIDHTVRAGTSVPVTFTFRHAGTGEVDAMVESRDDGSSPASLTCDEVVR